MTYRKKVTLPFVTTPLKTPSNKAELAQNRCRSSYGIVVNGIGVLYSMV